MKKFLLLLFVLGLSLSVSVMSGCGFIGSGNNGDDPSYVVEITVEDYGVITVALDDTYAPITVENFVNLVNDGFYDGLTFHRIIENFVIQGGCDLGNGMGGSDNRIVGEFSDNGIENPMLHTRGVISMARLGHDPNSASSQFFILHADVPHLDGGYAAFGHVISGMEVVDAIVEGTEIVPGSDGTVLPENQPVITSMRVIESD